jgi:lysophospholipase L1-like esterase
MRATRALIIAVLLPLTLGLATATLAAAAEPAKPVYLSLGTSLSVGVQPDRDGSNRRTRDGYADQLYGMLLPGMPDLKLQTMGCPGETTQTMIAGGICAYDAGSQLAEAVGFLRARGHSVVLVTLDIGANDVQQCGSLAGIDPECFLNALTQAPANLYYILATLRAAAPGVPIVAMNYYNPFAAVWPLPLAEDAAEALSFFNSLLEAVYGGFSVPVADVATAFHANPPLTPDPAFGGHPLAQVLICQWTWMCAAPPAGPNIHPKFDGYTVIAGALFATLPPLP